MAVSKLITPKDLNKILQGNTAGIRLLDCTYQVGVKPDPVEFRQKYYGKFEELIKIQSPQKKTFLQSHIPTARHFDLDLAMYPGLYQRFAVYEPEVFQQYAQLIGVHRDDQIILYSRGPFGGMLFAAKSYWLFKTYGHKELVLVNGGFDEWTKEGLETETLTEEPAYEKGTFLARDFRHRNVTFEELTEKDADGKDLLERAAEYNLLDSRIRAQFDNDQDTGLNAFVVPGSHLPNSANVPANEFIGSNGKLLPKAFLKAKLENAGFDPEKKTITLCNTGMQASLLNLVLDEVYPNSPLRLYNGSLKELEIRDPGRICGGIKPVGKP
uniref:Rhodanese-like protein n=1 Tax=Panagrellus redivivus TaxID=6233 RepID=A0A7E4WDL5_PANRE